MDAELMFGQWLKRRRRGLGMTQVELGRRTGYSGETIRKVEADEIRPSHQMAQKLADALEVPVEDRPRFVRFARGEADDDSVALPPSPPSIPQRRALPVPLTSFVGREREIAEIKRLLKVTRLLTLTGPGGSGKTRLALRAATDFRDEFRDGVYFVNLAPISDPSLVAPTVAQTLDVRGQGPRPILDLLKDHLRDKNLLLILDNFEQITGAAPLVSELLVDALELTVLVTSRAVLHISGEHEFPVPPLSMPDVRRLVGSKGNLVSSLSQYSCVRLFIERAVAVQPDFAVTEDNAAAIAEICQRLDGLPLAIELAAARARVLPPHAILARLDQRLKLLRDGPRDVPARQQTLRDTIDWSYNLLNEVEQTFFRRLSVFVGGFTLEAAESLCNPLGALEVDVLDGVEALVAKSLLRHDGDDDVWFVMLETIREYALDKLQVVGEAEEVRAQHFDYFMRLAETAGPAVSGPEGATGIDRLERERGNLRAALGWALNEPRRFVEGARLVLALVQFWQLRGDFEEGVAWLDLALVRNVGAPAQARAELFDGRGLLALHRNSPEQARHDFEQAAALSRQAGDMNAFGRAVSRLAFMALDRGDLTQALDLAEQGLEIQRETGNKWWTCVALLALGDALYLQGDLQRARECFEEGLALAREVVGGWAVARRLVRVGQASRAYGDLRPAHIQLNDALILARDLRDDWSVTMALAALGRLALAEGQLERAAILFSAVQAHLDTVGARLWPLDRFEQEEAVASLRVMLTPDILAPLWSEGMAMTLEQAVAYALAQPAGAG